MLVQLLIAKTVHDSDGYWIYLKPGYQVDGDHAIVEDTKRAAVAKLRSIKPCDCAICQFDLQTLAKRRER